jgi:hypothetical protein
MGWDGAGGYTRQHNFSADASAGIKILALRMDTEFDDMASAITLAWARNGQNVPTQAVPMGGQRFINVGAATSVGNYMRVREFIENVPIFMQDVEASADRISVSAQYFTSVSANQAPGDGTRILVRAKSNKSSAVLYLNGHSANVEYKDGGRIASAVTSGGVYAFVYSSADSAWQLENPDAIGSRITYEVTSAETSASLTPTNFQYPPGHRYRYLSVLDGVDFHYYQRTAAEVAGSVTPSDYRYPPGDVRRYGAVGDNVTDDLTALRAAFSQFEQAGGAAVVFERGKTYYCGSFGSNTVLFSIDSVTTGGMIFGNGARIRVASTASASPIAVQFNNCRLIQVFGLRFTDDSFSQGTAAGLVCFDVRASGATDEDIGHITLHDCEANGAVMLLRVAGDSTGEASTNQANRIRNVRVRGGRTKTTFYVANLQNHGDDCDIDVHAEDCERCVFGYGITGLRFNVHIVNPRGGFAQILCKAYNRSTEGWRGDVYFESAVSSFEAVLFEFENDTQDESIRDMDFSINMRNTASGTTPVTFRAFESDGSTTRTTTTNRWDNIRLRGDWTNFSNPIAFTTRQSTEGRLILDPSLANQLASYTNLNGFVLLPSVDREVRTVTGDLTSNSITIPCSRYDGQVFELEVTVSLHDPTDGGTSAAATLTQRDIIKASNSGSGGSVSVLDTLNLFRFTRESTSITALGTVTYTASGENIVVSFSTHTHASCHARVEVKHLRGYA